jgi:hypothetical protein
MLTRIEILNENVRSFQPKHDPYFVKTLMGPASDLPCLRVSLVEAFKTFLDSTNRGDLALMV